MAQYKNGEYITDLSTFYPVRYGLYGSMAKSEGLMPSESSRYEGDEYEPGNEDGDEDMTEYEDESGEVGGVPEADLPKFRTLVKNKKLELKNQYGKGKFKVTKEWKRKCFGGWFDKLFDNKKPVWDSNLNCVNYQDKKRTWVPGWRRKWREFKQSGGLANLKLQARGVIPIPSSTPTPPTSTPTPPTPPIKPPVKVKRNVLPRAIPIGAGPSADTTPSADATQRGMTTGKGKIIIYGIIAVVVIGAIWLVMKTVAKKAA